MLSQAYSPPPDADKAEELEVVRLPGAGDGDGAKPGAGAVANPDGTSGAGSKLLYGISPGLISCALAGSADGDGDGAGVGDGEVDRPVGTGGAGSKLLKFISPGLRPDALLGLREGDSETGAEAADEADGDGADSSLAGPPLTVAVLPGLVTAALPASEGDCKGALLNGTGGAGSKLLYGMRPGLIAAAPRELSLNGGGGAADSSAAEQAHADSEQAMPKAPVATSITDSTVLSASWAVDFAT